MMTKPKNLQSGFSLIELLVAVVILAVGLLGLAQLQLTAIKTNSQSFTSTAASVLTQRVLEQVASIPPDDPLFDGPSSGTWSKAPITSPVTLSGGGSYDITYVVEPVDSDNDPSTDNDVTNLYKVTVTVSSAGEVSHVLGNRVRTVVGSVVKRAI
jgi:type IV pilus assembly protein PilV